jgi:hypothetical protein
MSLLPRFWKQSSAEEKFLPQSTHWNLNSNIGLVNGAIGYRLVYKQGDKAPSLPQMLVVEINDYCAPPFFSGEGHEQWVPLLPVKRIWSGFGQDDKEHYRNQFPISLAWGLTVWKAQGRTITTKLGYELGTKEP